MTTLIPSWRAVLTRYATPTRLHTVTQRRGFTVVADGDVLRITPDSSGKTRPLTQADFAKAAPLLGRRSIQETTHNSSYIAPIVEDFRRA